jgi:hypothetical protein
MMLCLFSLSIYEEEVYTSIYRWAGNIPSDLAWLSVAQVTEYKNSYGGAHWITKEAFAFGLFVGVQMASILWIGLLLIKRHWKTAGLLILAVLMVSIFAVFGSIAQAVRQWPMEEFTLAIMSEIDDAFVISNDSVSDQSTINIDVANLEILQVSDHVVIYGIKRHLFNSGIPLRTDNPYFGRNFSNEFSSSVDSVVVPEKFEQCMDELNNNLDEVGGVIGAERLLSRRGDLSIPQSKALRFLTLKYREYAFVVVELSDLATAKGFTSGEGLELVVDSDLASGTNIVENYTVVQAIHEYAPYELSAPSPIFDGLVNNGMKREVDNFSERLVMFKLTWQLLFSQSILQDAISNSSDCSEFL